MSDLQEKLKSIAEEHDVVIYWSNGFATGCISKQDIDAHELAKRMVLVRVATRQTLERLVQLANPPASDSEINSLVERTITCYTQNYLLADKIIDNSYFKGN